MSPVEHSSPSSHSIPDKGENTHPTLGLHDPEVQTFPSSHTTGVPVQTPSAHWSFAVHSSPSLHAAELKE
jgi:hypothetical protein